LQNWFFFFLQNFNCLCIINCEYLLEGNQDFYKSKFDKAIEAYEKAIEIKPNYEAYYNIGVAYTSSNKFKEAIKAYEKAINLSLSSCKIGFFSSCKILIVFALSIV
jgi:tetratricopeptide (TPR) repeat protein